MFGAFAGALAFAAFLRLDGRLAGYPQFVFVDGIGKRLRDGVVRRDPALAGDEVGGQYCEDCHVAELQEEGRGGARGYIRDPEHAKALWAKSEEMVGETF